jgi:serine/threonine protein kinase
MAFGTRIGCGTYCSVYLLQDDPESVAKVYTSSNEKFEDYVLREIAILTTFKHTNIVNLRKVQTTEAGKVMLIMEKCKSELRPRKYKYDLLGRRKIIREVLQAISYLHSHGVIHRDVKPPNILLANDGAVRLCDFNTAMYMGLEMCSKHTKHSIEAGTLWWRAPEALLDDYHYDYKVDIWAVGMVLLSLILGEEPLKGNNCVQQLFITYQMLGTPGTDEIWPDASTLPNWSSQHPQWTRGTLQDVLQTSTATAQEKDLLSHMLTYPNTRQPALWLLEHSYFH